MLARWLVQRKRGHDLDFFWSARIMPGSFGILFAVLEKNPWQCLAVIGHLPSSCARARIVDEARVQEALCLGGPQAPGFEHPKYYHDHPVSILFKKVLFMTFFRYFLYSASCHPYKWHMSNQICYLCLCSICRDKDCIYSMHRYSDVLPICQVLWIWHKLAFQEELEKKRAELPGVSNGTDGTLHGANDAHRRCTVYDSDSI